jgi:hypothetical protein
MQAAANVVGVTTLAAASIGVTASIIFAFVSFIAFRISRTLNEGFLIPNKRYSRSDGKLAQAAVKGIRVILSLTF